MSLTGAQKTAAALSFVPGVSAIVGVVEAFVYSKRSSRHDREIITSSEGRVNVAAMSAIKRDGLRELNSVEKSLAVWGVVKMIPVVNVVVALAELFYYYPKLSKAQEISEIDSPVLLLNHYGVAKLDNERQSLDLNMCLEQIYDHFENKLDPDTLKPYDNAKMGMDQVLHELAERCREKVVLGKGKDAFLSALSEVIDHRYEDTTRSRQRKIDWDFVFKTQRLEKLEKVLRRA